MRCRDHRLSTFPGVLLLLLVAACDSTTPLRAENSNDVFTGPANRSIDGALLEQIPIKEVTVFKDGHAFVLHEGTLPVDHQGRVHLDHLPTPVLGTFWPYARGKNVQLKSVRAARQKVRSKQAALEYSRFGAGQRGRESSN